MSTTIEQTLRALISDWSVAAILLRGQRVIEFNPAAAEWLGETSGSSIPGTHFRIWLLRQIRPFTDCPEPCGAIPIGTTVSLACAQAGNCVAEPTLIEAGSPTRSSFWPLAANPSEVPGGFGRDWRFLRHVIDTSSAMIFVKDREGRFCSPIGGLAKAYNLAVEEVEGRLNASLHSNPEEIEAFLRDDREVMDSRQSKLIVAEPVTYSDGSVHRYSTVKTPLFLDSAHCDHVLGIATNIDELKAAERELQQSEYLLRSIIDNTSAVVFVKGLDGRYLRINKRFTDLFHVSNEALLGRTDYDLFPQTSPTRCVLPTRTCSGRGKPWSLRRLFRRTTGCTLTWCSNSLEESWRRDLRDLRHCHRHYRAQARSATIGTPSGRTESYSRQ